METDDLDSIAKTPGVIGVLLCDDFGGVLGSVGRAAPAAHETAVLSQAAHSASDAMGFRVGLGPCTEIIQRHPHGGLRIRRVGTQRFLLIWYEHDVSETDLEAALSGWKPSSSEEPEPQFGAEIAAPHVPAGTVSGWDPFASTPSP